MVAVSNLKIGSDVRVDSVVANYVFDCENFATCGALVRFRSGYEVFVGQPYVSYSELFMNSRLLLVV